MGKMNVSKARWNKSGQRKFRASIDEINILTGNSYGVVAEGFFSKEAIRGTAEGVDLVLVSAAGHRPPEYAMTGLVEDSIVVPTERSEDLKLLARATKVKREELFPLFSLLRWDFGLIRKSEAPIHLRGAEDAALVGVRAEFEEARIVDPSAEIWWQKWGGALYSFSVEKERIGIIHHGILLGDYELVPLHLIS